MSGQINRGTPAGEAIYALSSDKDNMIFVEIGTWNGKKSLAGCYMLEARFHVKQGEMTNKKYKI